MQNPLCSEVEKLLKLSKWGGIDINAPVGEFTEKPPPVYQSHVARALLHLLGLLAEEYSSEVTRVEEVCLRLITLSKEKDLQEIVMLRFKAVRHDFLYPSAMDSTMTFNPVRGAACHQTCQSRRR
jgi:hypothetical protein